MVSIFVALVLCYTVDKFRFYLCLRVIFHKLSFWVPILAAEGPYFIKSWAPIGSLFLSLEVPISFRNSGSPKTLDKCWAIFFIIFSQYLWRFPSDNQVMFFYRSLGRLLDMTSLEGAKSYNHLSKSQNHTISTYISQGAEPYHLYISRGWKPYQHDISWGSQTIPSIHLSRVKTIPSWRLSRYRNQTIPHLSSYQKLWHPCIIPPC